MCKNINNKRFILGLLVSLFLVGCRYNVESSCKDSSKNDDNSVEKNFCSKTKVFLADGVNYSDLDITIDNRISYLVDELSKKTGKYISPDEEMIKEDSLMEILQKKVDDLLIPNFENPTEEDIKKIQKKFPELTEEQILDELDTIESIYESEIAALVVQSFIDNSTAVGSDVPYEDVINSRSLLGSAKKFWKKITGKTSSAVKKIKQVELKDGWRALKIGDDSITVYEVAVILRYPLSALKLSKVKEKSYELTNQYMGSAKKMRDKVDAFRHSIFTIALAKEGVGRKSNKLNWARDFSTAHEMGYKYSACSAEMDIHNNFVGLNYYDKMTKRGYKKILFFKVEVSPDEPSYSECCKYLKEKTETAEFVDDRLDYDVFIEKLCSVDSNTLVWIKFDEEDN